MTVALTKKGKAKTAAPKPQAAKPKPRKKQTFGDLWSGAASFDHHTFIAQPIIQPKLKIGDPNDKYEQEADRVADEVMRMPDSEVMGMADNPPFAESSLPAIQRMCSDCAMAEETVQRKPNQATFQPPKISSLGSSYSPQFLRTDSETHLQRQAMEEEEEEPLQMKRENNASPAITPGIAAGIQSLAGGGQPLSQSERTFFEPRFNRDLSQVRIHTDTQAAHSAKALSAKALTTGHHIVFGKGEYAPQTETGKRLLAHELTHVIQQNQTFAAEPHPPVVFSQSSAIIQKQDDSESGREENPSYDEALDHLRTFYQRQQTIVQILARMRDRALELFTSYSSETLNPAEPELMDLLEAAIAIIPAADAIGQTLRVLRNRHGFLLRPLMDSPVALASSGVTLSSEARGVLPGDGEGAAREEFRISTIESLADIEVETLSAWWQEEDQAREQLRSLRYTSAEVDLLAQMRERLGEIPTAQELETVSRLVRDQFELKLYRRFYFGTSGRAAIHVYLDEFSGRPDASTSRYPPALELEGLPPAVRQRITDLNGWEIVTANWSPRRGFLTSSAQGRSMTLPASPSEEVVERMTGRLLIPELASRVLQTFRLLFDPLNPASSLMMHDTIRSMVDESGVVVDPAERALWDHQGMTRIWHEPWIFQRELLSAGASELELLTIVRIISSGSVHLYHELGGTPYVDAR